MESHIYKYIYAYVHKKGFTVNSGHWEREEDKTEGQSGQLHKLGPILHKYLAPFLRRIYACIIYKMEKKIKSKKSGYKTISKSNAKWNVWGLQGTNGHETNGN